MIASVDEVVLDQIARQVRALEPPDVAADLADQLTVANLDEATRDKMLAKWRAEREEAG